MVVEYNYNYDINLFFTNYSINSFITGIENKEIKIPIFKEILITFTILKNNNSIKV